MKMKAEISEEKIFIYFDRFPSFVAFVRFHTKPSFNVERYVTIETKMLKVSYNVQKSPFHELCYFLWPLVW
jgi:hypothetical protein